MIFRLCVRWIISCYYLEGSLVEGGTQMSRILTFGLLLILVALIAGTADAGVVIYLPMDEGQGDTVADHSGNGNDGVLEDGPIWVDGKSGKALQFSGGSRVHILASNSLHGDIFKDDFTLLAWINPDFAGDQWEHVWRSVDGNDATQCSLFLNIDGFLSWRGRVADAWGERCGTPAGTINANEWTHIALTSDKVNYRIYVNGAEAGSSAFEEMDGGITDYYLGFDGREWAEAFSGVIDEVYLLTVAMPADEIAGVAAGTLASVQPAAKLATTWGDAKGNK